MSPGEPRHGGGQLGHHDDPETGPHQTAVYVVPVVVVDAGSGRSPPDGSLDTLQVVSGARPPVGHQVLWPEPHQGWGGEGVEVSPEQGLVTSEEGGALLVVETLETVEVVVELDVPLREGQQDSVQTPASSLELSRLLTVPDLATGRIQRADSLGMSEEDQVKGLCWRV